MKITRVWSMPNALTFQIKPVKEFIARWIPKEAKLVIVDPFARDSRIGNITNDLNPGTSALFHMDVVEFLKMLVEKKIKADAILFDPPYSPRQIKECYNGIGLKMLQREALRTSAWKVERDLMDRILRPAGVVLSFGWNSTGMGKKRDYIIKEILLVNHGSSHNDLICMAEERVKKEGHV